MSFGSAWTSCSRTSAAFSNFDFLRYSAAESLSLRESAEAMRTLFYPCCTVLSHSPPRPSRVGARRSGHDSSSPPLPARGRRWAVPVAPGGERRQPGGRRLRLLACLLAQRVHLGGRQLAVIAGPQALHPDTAVVGAVQLQDRRAHRFHQPFH